MVRVTFVAGQEIPGLSNPVLTDASCIATGFSVSESAKALDLVAAGVHVAIAKNSGALRFKNAQDDSILAESDWPYPRNLVTSKVNDESRTTASTWFALDANERLYGLGQHQTGLLNQRNTQLEVSQDNTNISLPFFLSSKGYGVLWNSAAVTDWNNRFRPVLAIQSDWSDAVDYYYLAGPSFDKIIQGYRKLTGQAPLFPKWAYGFWQSKLAYASSNEVLATVAKYRALHIPLDNLVIDAGWETGFGSRQFNQNYPDPKAMVQSLHEAHAHVMVSIWPLFQPGNANFDDFRAKGYFVTPGPNHLPAYLAGAELYDAFSEPARKAYWEQVKTTLYSMGVDAFWMDSTEPADLYAEEHGPMLADAKTALGNGSRYANLFPLMTTASIYDGQRREPDAKRVFILTRSAFSGMQRNAATAWSGDTLTNFDTLRRQIPAGLNYSMTGLPYWTTDIGGFVGGDTSDPAYRELYIRWFEYGTFCPIFRTHGARKNNQNELWSFGPEAQKVLTNYDRLRYRLLPYIYSLAAKTTFEGYTPMRALVFDFADDDKALDISDEFMLGPSLLVAPVTDAGARRRSVYLPKDVNWYDYWTGVKFAGGQIIQRDAPLGVLPLYVRAGSILPLGPEEEYTDQHTDAPIELRVYPGADSDTRMYWDDGESYQYEQGKYAWVPIHWDDGKRTIRIDAAQGDLGMLPHGQKFLVTRIGKSKTKGSESVAYLGRKIEMALNPQ